MGGNADPARDARKGERTRRRILEAAAKCFGRDGYADTSLAAIAAEAQMRAGSLYYHFESKDAIVEGVLRAGIRHADQAIREAVDPDDSGRDQLAAPMRAYLSSILEQSQFTRANIRCYDEVSSALRTRNARQMRAFVATWVRLYESGVRDGSLRRDVDVAALVKMLIAALNSCARGRHLAAADAAADAFVRVFIEGCRRR